MLSPWKVPPQVYNLLQVIRSPEAQICRVLGHPGLPRPPCPDGQAQAGQGDPGSCQPVNVCGEGHSILLSLLIFHSWGLGVPQPPPHSPLVSPSRGHPLLPPVVTRGRRSQASERHGANPTGGQRGAGGGSRLYKDELRIWPACPQGQRSTRPWLPCGVGDGLYEPGAGIRPSSPTAESPLLPSRVRAAAPPRKCCLAVPPPPPGPCHRKPDR